MRAVAAVLGLAGVAAAAGLGGTQAALLELRPDGSLGGEFAGALGRGVGGRDRPRGRGRRRRLQRDRRLLPRVPPALAALGRLLRGGLDHRRDASPMGRGGRGHPGQRRVREGLGPRLRRDLSDLLDLHPGHRRRRRRPGEPARSGRSLRVRRLGPRRRHLRRQRRGPLRRRPRGGALRGGRRARGPRGLGAPRDRRVQGQRRVLPPRRPHPLRVLRGPGMERRGGPPAHGEHRSERTRGRLVRRGARVARPALPHRPRRTPSASWRRRPCPPAARSRSAPRTTRNGATWTSERDALAGRLHEFRPDGLEPDSKYFYRVLCAADAPRPDQLDLASEVRSFRTAPKPHQGLRVDDLHRRRRHPGQRRGGRPRLGPRPTSTAPTSSCTAAIS